MVSVPVPPSNVSMLLTVPVFVTLARVSVVAPAPRSTCMLSVSALPSVMVSPPPPPMIDWVFDTVAALAKSPKVSVSAPPPD